MLLIVFVRNGFRAILAVWALEGERIEDAHFKSTKWLHSLCATLGRACVFFLIARQGQGFCREGSLAEDCFATYALYRVKGNISTYLAYELLEDRLLLEVLEKVGLREVDDDFGGHCERVLKL